MKAISLPGYRDNSRHKENNNDKKEELNTIDLHDSLQYVSEHNACFAHTLQHLIVDGFKEIGALYLERLLPTFHTAMYEL